MSKKSLRRVDIISKGKHSFFAIIEIPPNIIVLHHNRLTADPIMTIEQTKAKNNNAMIRKI